MNKYKVLFFTHGEVIMKRKLYLFAILALVLFVLAAGRNFVKAESTKQPSPESRLAVVWTSGDPDVAHRVCLMYTNAAKNAGWFEEVKLVVWGPSARLLAGDKDLQAKIKKMMGDGILVQACVVCADSYGVSESIRQMGIEVKPMGKPLSDMLKGNWKVLTF